MTDRPNPGAPEDPQNAAEASGSVFKRLRHPVKNSGEPTGSEQQEALEQSADEGPDPAAAGPKADNPDAQLGTPTNQIDSSKQQPATAEAHARGTTSGGLPATTPVDIQPPRAEDLDLRKQRRAERLVAAWFLASVLGAVGFVLAYAFTDPQYRLDQRSWHTILLGSTLALAISGIGFGLVIWAKKLMPDEEAVQQREPFAPTDAERQAAQAAWAKGLEESGFTKRPLLRRTMLGAVGALSLAGLVPLLSLGPKPGRKVAELKQTKWTPGAYLVDQQGARVKLGQLQIQSFMTVYPEGHTGVEAADSFALLFRLRPDDIKDDQTPVDNEGNLTEEPWNYQGHLVYSAVCTHLGCPAKLWESQTHHLLCPCHQSVFDITEHARPIFGPAARSLPQLPIFVDDEGFFRARSDFRRPVGPGFWELG